MRKPAVVILAAGRGTRMRSDLPKALHAICGKSMLWFLVEKARRLKPEKIVVVAGYRKDLIENYLFRHSEESVGRRSPPSEHRRVRRRFVAEISKTRSFSRLRRLQDDNIKVVWQKKLLGSGHAVNQAAGKFSKDNGSVLVLYCDTPLISQDSISALLKNHSKAGTDCSMLSVRLTDPSGYGRVKRDRAGRVEAIVEEGDCSEEEKRITEVNVGCYIFRSKKLFDALKAIRKNPNKKEYYLTDVIELLARDGKVESLLVRRREEMLGVNTRLDLARLQDNMQENILNSLIEKGITIRDPKTTVIDAGVMIGAGSVILPHTVIEESSAVGRGCTIGPFARIRGGSVIGDGSVIGNFVEIVRSKIGKNTQVKHLSYIGDAEVGSFVNIGAGTITANYDGRKKHRTVIKDKAHIGSGTILVAPVTIGRGAKTGAGAVVTKGKNVKAGTIVVGVPARKL